MKKRVLSILLCLVMIIGLSPTSLHADDDYDDGVECEYCGEYIWGDWLCPGGDHCGEESGYFDCYDAHHCAGCGEEMDKDDLYGYCCEECGLGPCCIDADELCKNCLRCVDCIGGELCNVCGWCPECSSGNEKLCEMCGRCYDCGGGMCSEGDEHPCQLCHDFYVCSDCGACLLNPDDQGKMLDFCFSCYRCENCVEKCSAWGENHFYCRDCHDDFDYCPDCYHCYAADIIAMTPGNSYGCVECNLCINCVSTVCESCGKCFECVGICERCGEKCLECHEDAGEACPRCGMCNEGVEFHIGCGICWECLDSCPDCGKCMECDEDAHCPGCGACSRRGGAVLCDSCGFCSDCTEYCDECGLCATCESDTHCSVCFKHSDDDDLCSNCGACGDCVDLCDDCGMCKDCADEKDHCSECGACHENTPICEDCGMCDSCAKDANQHCDNAGCDNCYENYLYCSVCDKCIECIGEDDYCFDCYQCKSHHVGGKCDGKGEHTHKVGDWQSNANYHWQQCRLCKEELLKSTHKFNSEKKCTVCGYDANEPIVITKQPKDVRAKVSDCDADKDDPLSENNNTVFFTVAATADGRGTLSYQWYYKYEGSDKIYPVKDFDRSEDGRGITTGATTTKLIIPVSTEACISGLQYFCRITLKSSDGTGIATLDSDAAALKASHVYNRCKPANSDPDKGYTLYILGEDGKRQKTRVPLDDGHLYYCCGEGDEEHVDPTRKTPMEHVYGAPTLIKAGGTWVDELSDWYKYTCKDCRAVKYVKKHEHKFELKEDAALMEAYCTDETHPLACQVNGCTAIRHDKHNFKVYIERAPHANTNGTVTPGKYYLYCTQCEYVLEGKDLYEANDKTHWDTLRTLVTADDAGVQVLDSFDNFDNFCLGTPGATVMLFPNSGNSVRITGWTAKYTDFTQKDADGNYKTIDITINTYKNTSDGTWWFVIPTEGYYNSWGVNGGGWLHLTPKGTACKHANGTKLANKVDAVCIYDGYSGDEVCVDCGKLLGKTGDFIAAPSTEHEGTWELIKGTDIEATCYQCGYTGDYKCSACGDIKSGEILGYKHGDTEIRNAVESTCVTPGYSGDTYCKECDTKIQSGNTLSLNKNKHEHRKIVGAYAPTCMLDGSTGETRCVDCDALLTKARRISSLGHKWDEGTVTKEPTSTETGTMVYHCTRDFSAGTAIATASSRTKRPALTPVRKTKCSATRTVSIPALSSSTVASVALTVTVPVAGGKASGATTTESTCTIANTSWVDEGGNDVAIGSEFKTGKTYIVKVELEATGDNAFTSETSFTVNGAAATVVMVGLDSAIVKYTFPKIEGSGTPVDPNPDNPEPDNPNPDNPNPDNPEPDNPNPDNPNPDNPNPDNPNPDNPNPDNPNPDNPNPDNPNPDNPNPDNPNPDNPNPDNPDDNTQPPQTGDNSMIGFLSILSLVSGFCIVGIALHSKKKRYVR